RVALLLLTRPAPPRCTLFPYTTLFRSPGSRESLLQARADGANVHIVYSPLDAVQFAEAHPDREIVFFAVGFETTAPATALAVHQDRKSTRLNSSHRTISYAVFCLKKKI